MPGGRRHTGGVEPGLHSRVHLAVTDLATRHVPRGAWREQPAWGEGAPNAAFVELCEQMGKTGKQLGELVAEELARGFADETLAYNFCDDLANELMQWITELDEPTLEEATLFWRVYEAFDAGEYRHRDDAEDVNPVEKYTRPLILAAVKGL